jgi:hypothetical protein
VGRVEKRKWTSPAAVMYIAQFNISIEKAPLDDPLMQDFVNSLAHVNQAADETDGFVWRLHDDSGNATDMRVFDDKRIIFNLSVWKSIELLKKFVYHNQHMSILKRRREWFETNAKRSYVLWWVPENHRPSTEEAKARLFHLQEKGPTPFAFTFDQVFEPEGSDVA